MGNHLQQNISLLQLAENTRKETLQVSKKSVRQTFSQYLTPQETARLAVSLFSMPRKNQFLHCLDLGAGTGILTVALFEFYKNIQASYDCFELSKGLANICKAEMDQFDIPCRIILGDVLQARFCNCYDRVILNPPYKKMSARNPYQGSLPVNSPNLYTAFLMHAIQALKKNGEMVAIIPRSWTNGTYFRPFRKWLFSQVSIDAIHIYGSRSEIFSDTDVLQETMILKVSKRKQRELVTISESLFKDSAITTNKYKFVDLVSKDEDSVFCLYTTNNYSKHLVSLRTNGFCASTGKIVDFRSKEYLSTTKSEQSVPLIYPCNLQGGTLIHPTHTSKYQWYTPQGFSTQQLLLPGAYVAVNRFSAKEEQRRIKAAFIHVTLPVAIENHINYIHCGTSRENKPISEEIARGLCMWLNSSFPERWFRARSGSTQVNASDLNAMPIPSTQILRRVSHLWLDKQQTQYLDSCFERFI